MCRTASRDILSRATERTLSAPQAADTPHPPPVTPHPFRCTHDALSHHKRCPHNEKGDTRRRRPLPHTATGYGRIQSMSMS